MALAVGAPHEKALRPGRVEPIDSALVVRGAGAECTVPQATPGLNVLPWMGEALWAGRLTAPSQCVVRVMRAL